MTVARLAEIFIEQLLLKLPGPGRAADRGVEL
jgi:hypothetical protein